MKKHKTLLLSLLIINITIVSYLLLTLNKRKSTTYICTVSGTKKVIIEEYFSVEESIYPSALEYWIKVNFNKNFKNTFVIRSQKIEPIIGGISRGSGGRVPVATALNLLEDIVKYNSNETLSNLVKILESGNKEEGHKAIDAATNIVFNHNGINELFNEK